MDPQPTTPTPPEADKPLTPVEPPVEQEPVAPNTQIYPSSTPVPTVVQPAPQPVTEPVNQTSTPMAQEAAPAMTTPVVGSQLAKQNRRKLGMLGMVVLGLLVLLGGGAAAYFGYVVPNKPDNIVLAALADLAGQTEITSDSTIDVTLKKDNTSVAIDLNAESNSETSQLKLDGVVGVNGGEFPFEVRYLDKDIYLKVGGLDSISQMLDAYGLADQGYGDILNKVNDQWYVIDRSFWQSFGEQATCITDLSFRLTDEDVSLVKNAYKKHPLFKVTSSSKERVGDTDTTKYVVDPTTDEEASAFVDELKELSVVKKAKECARDTGTESLLDEEVSDIGTEQATSGNVSIALYVTGDKKLKKIEMTGEDDESTYKISTVYDYHQISITKPDGAKPLQELLNDLYGGFMPIPYGEDGLY